MLSSREKPLHIPPELLPVVQITLPLIIAILGANYFQNKRIDDIVKRLDAIEARLQKIEDRLANFGERIARLEERISPIIHRN